jgi:hypothetical protein
MPKASMAENRTWNLESFLDSLIVELDKAQDTLALKGMNRPLTYTVKDLALELQTFPVYTNDGIMFATARPGESGSSKMSLQLGSISDRQIRETTKEPVSMDDVTVEMLDEIDDDTKKTLKKIGVKSVSDLERMEKKNVDIGKVTGKKVNYKDLAAQIAKAKRHDSKPEVKNFSLAKGDQSYVLSLSGANLALDSGDADFPIALVNRIPTKVISASADQIELDLKGHELQSGSNELTIALDRYSIIRIDLRA